MPRLRALPFVSICVLVLLTLSCGGGGGGGTAGASGAQGVTVVPASDVSTSNNNSYGFSKNSPIVVSTNSNAGALDTPAYAKTAKVQSTKANAKAKGEGIYSEALKKLGIVQINLLLTIDGVTSEHTLGANDALVLKQVTPGTSVVASGTVQTADGNTRKIVQKEYNVEAFQDTLPLFVEYNATLKDSVGTVLESFVYSTDKPIVLPTLNDVTVDAMGDTVGVAPFLGWQVSAPGLSIDKNFYPKGATVPAGELCGDIEFLADYGFCVYQLSDYTDDLYIEDDGIEMPVSGEVELYLVNVTGNTDFFDSVTVTNTAIATFEETSAADGIITANALGNTNIVVEGKSWRKNNYSVQIPVVVGDVIFDQAYYDNPKNTEFNAKTAKHLEQIAKLAETNNFMGKTITLENDIDATGLTGFEGIKITSGFMGTFDGAGCSVTVDIASNANELGFISALGSSGEVKDLTVKGNITNTSTSGTVAGIVGNNAGTITGCTNEAKFSGASNVAGITATNTGTVEDCKNTVNLTGEQAAGIARNNKGTIENCVNSGTITGQDGAGGIVVTGSQNSTITKCLNEGAVIATDSTPYAYAGGIISEHQASGGEISLCTNTGAVTSTSGRAGGIAGSSSSTITASSNEGTITGDYAGGIAGKGSTIEWCKNTGDISGTSYSGGVVGSIDTSLANSYAKNCVVSTATTNKAGAVYGNTTNQAESSIAHMNVTKPDGSTWAGGASNFTNFIGVFDAGSGTKKVGYYEYDFY